MLYLLCVLFTLSSAQTVTLVKPGKIAKYGDCEYVKELPSNQQCDYIKLPSNPCVDADGFFFNYARTIYCNNYNKFPALYGALIFIFILVINLFLVVGLIADSFFCPTLAAAAVVFGLSENLAGVTLVAFGNGAPDLFASVSGLTGNPDVELVFSQIMGGGLFVTLFVVGTICITAPFKMEGALLMRDCLFYTFAVIWAFLVLRSPKVYLWEAAVFITLYGVYITTVVLSQSKEEDADSRLSVYKLKAESTELAFNTKERMYMQMVTKTQSGRKYVDGLETEVIIIEHGLFMEFLGSIFPFEGWNDMGILERIICLWKAPFLIMLRLIIPIVDYDAPKQGWSKVQNIVNVFLLPIYTNIVTGTANYQPIGGVPMILITFLFSISLAVFVAQTSIQMEPPEYHFAVFAPLTFIGSVVTISRTANELVAVLSTLGLIIGITPTTLGCTLLAWGDGIGDFVTLLGLATKGFPKMALSGVYGGTLFDILFSLGVATLSATIYNGRRGKGYFLVSDTGTLGASMIMYLLGGLLSCLIMLPVMGFQARRSYGIYLIVIYVVFNVNILLNELELIHPLEKVYIQQIRYANGTVLYKDVKVLYN